MLKYCSLRVAAVSMGRGLREQAPPPMRMPMVGPGGIRGPGPPGGVMGGPPPPGSMPQKAPSAIKTNIKAGAQVHPYARQ